MNKRREKSLFGGNVQHTPNQTRQTKAKTNDVLRNIDNKTKYTQFKKSLNHLLQNYKLDRHQQIKFKKRPVSKKSYKKSRSKKPDILQENRPQKIQTKFRAKPKVSTNLRAQSSKNSKIIKPNFDKKSSSTKKMKFKQNGFFLKQKNIENHRILNSPQNFKSHFSQKKMELLNKLQPHNDQLKVNFFKIIKRKKELLEHNKIQQQRQKKNSMKKKTQSKKRKDLNLKNYITKVEQNTDSSITQLNLQSKLKKKINLKFLAIHSNKYYMPDLLKAISIGATKIQKHRNFQNHFEQTIQSIHFSTTLNSYEIQCNGDQVQFENHQSPKKTLIFDLDETLIHCTENKSDQPDVFIPVVFPTGESIQAGINIRPYAQQILQDLSKYFEIVIFTASHYCYANPVIDYLDSKGVVSKRMFRENCSQLKPGLFTKDLNVLLNRKLEDIILVDNAAYSFMLQLHNGIPILPFYNDKKDRELIKLKEFLLQLKDEVDVRFKIAEHFQWKIFKQFSNNPAKLIKKLTNKNFSLFLFLNLFKQFLPTSIKLIMFFFAQGLGGILEFFLLLSNAAAVINEQRVLKKYKPTFEETSTSEFSKFKSQIIFLLYTMRNYGRYILIVVNIVAIILKLLLG